MILYRPEIDGLRAIAVTAVLLFHLGLVKGGYVGVDVFFVISGYLITRLIVKDLDKDRFSFFDFYARRARRLMPALFCTIIVTLCAGLLLSTPYYLDKLAGSALAAVASVSNIYFWAGSGYFDDEAIFKPLLHTWSLGVEEQMYLVWPALLVVLAAGRRHFTTLGVIIAIALVSFAANLAFLDQPAAIYFLTPFRVFEFAIGALIVWLERRYPADGFIGEASVGAGLILIIASAALLTKHSTFPAWNALYPCVGAGLIIYGGQAAIGAARLLRQPLLVALGLRSYSIYLVHWPLISFYQSDSLKGLSDGDCAVLLLLSIALGAAMYRYVEQPFRARSGHAPAVPTLPAATLGAAACLAIGVVGSLLWFSNGWVSRLPKELREAVATMTAEQQDYWNIPSGAKFATSGKTNVLVFGNSFGIDTYYGLAQYPELEVVYSGTTHFACVAFLVRANPAGPDCRERNLALLRANDVANADIVVLSELWAPHLGAQQYAQTLDELYAAIRAINPSVSIALVGPRMTFVGRVVDRLIRYGSLDGAEEAMRRFYAVPLDKLRAFDKQMAARARDSGVSYISVVDLMCGADTCKVLTPGEYRQIYMDDGHFARKGAEYVGTLTWQQHQGILSGRGLPYAGDAMESSAIP